MRSEIRNGRHMKVDSSRLNTMAETDGDKKKKGMQESPHIQGSVTPKRIS